jgi:hypothetical protein
MILLSGINLKEEMLEFINNNQNLLIIVPFIKIDALKYLLSGKDNCRQIIVRWLPKDIIDGASDLEVYEYCKSNNISLFRNPRIHMKVFLSEYNNCILGSANISENALAINNTYNYNYEVDTNVKELTFEDKLYFHNILNESTLITDEIFSQIKKHLFEYDKVSEKKEDFDLNISQNIDYFLISALPMTEHIDLLKKIYFEGKADNNEQINCALHDLANYNIELGLNEKMFFETLKYNFFSHPFIQTFLKYVDDIGGDIYFGKVKYWFQNNTTTVPTPRKWELTKNVQILYKWITDLAPDKYIVDRPNYSERLVKI